MSGYLVFEIEVTDAAAYETYRKVAGPIMARAGGKFLVKSGRIVSLEGGWRPPSLFVVEFPSFEQARTFYYSKEYQETLDLRAASSKARGILVEGL
ncbi:MAG: DUF1330 domain-containing protein [Proteobacteria bacterium]|nr:DUF1330 domain-containing protein [Pseudomonadota bacterium]